MPSRKRDIEKHYSVTEFVSKLRRFADALETGKRFHIKIAGERIYVPAAAIYNIEHERGDDGEEVEFQIKWERSEQADAAKRWPKGKAPGRKG